MPTNEIPLSGKPETFEVALNGSSYRLTTQYRDNALGGWFLDIADADSNPIVSGIALVTGADLLAQYRYLGIGGGVSLTVVNSAGGDAAPTFDNLGTDTHLVVAPL